MSAADKAQPKTAHLSGEDGYRLMVAALEVAGSVSPGVHKRIRRASERGEGTSSPVVDPHRLVELVGALESILGVDAVQKVITETHAQSRAARRRAVEAQRPAVTEG